MKQEITKRLKIYFLSPFFKLGFLANLGLVTLTYIGYLILRNNLILSSIWKLNVFTVIYLVFYFLIRNDLKKLKNDFTEAGFVFASIIVLLLVVLSYLELFWALLF